MVKSDTTNVIVLVGKERGAGRELWVDLDAIANPGGAIEMAADGDYDPVVSAVGEAIKSELVILQEDNLQGNTIDDAYASGDRALAYIPARGDEILALVKSGEDINVADVLVVEGGGSQLFVEAAGTESRYQLLALEDSGGALAANTLLHCRVL